MAIQVNGTQVIGNSRQLTNITSVDATTAAAITAAGVGGAADSVVSYSSAPAVGPEGSLYYNTADDSIYLSDGTAWVTLVNQAPLPTAGISTLPAVTEINAYGYTVDVKQYFSDDRDATTALIYAPAASGLPPGMSLTGSVLSHDGATFSGVNAVTHNFGITATDTANLTSTPKSLAVNIAATPSIDITASYLDSLFNSTNVTEFNSSATISSSDLPTNGETVVLAYMVGGGAGGNTSFYQGGWYFTGNGGAAKWVIGKAKYFEGATFSAAGTTGPGGWQGTSGKVSTLSVLFDAEHGTTPVYRTDCNDPNTNYGDYDNKQISIIGNGITGQFKCTSTFTYNQITVSAATALQIIDFSNPGQTDSWGGNPSNTKGGFTTLQRYGGGSGYAAYGSTGYQQSTYAGNGGSSYGQAGQYPGGSGSYSAGGAGGRLQLKWL